MPGKLTAVLLQDAIEEAQASNNGKWTSHLRRLLVHTAQATHLDALFGVQSSSLPVTLGTPAVGMAPFVGLAPSAHKQVSTI